MNVPIDRMVVSDIPLEPVPCVAASVSLGHVARLLDETRLDTVLVLVDPLAVVTNRDVVAAVAAGLDSRCPVSGLDLEPPVVTTEWTPLVEVLRDLLADHASCAVVVDRTGRPAGLVPLRLVVNALMGGPAWLAGLRLALHIEGELL